MGVDLSHPMVLWVVLEDAKLVLRELVEPLDFTNNSPEATVSFGGLDAGLGRRVCLGRASLFLEGHFDLLKLFIKHGIYFTNKIKSSREAVGDKLQTCNND